MSSALVSKKMAVKILLEMINIITEDPNINDFIQWKLIDREVSFLVSLEAKHFYKPSMLYIKVSTCY